MRQYRYVQQYVDRHGRLRVYFRRPGYASIPLPSDSQSAAFYEAYKSALANVPVPVPRELVAIPVDQRIRIPDGPAIGVYLLLLDGEITYVGSSREMPTRVKYHQSNGRPFDQVFYIATADEGRRALETQLIRRLRPKGNREGVRRIAYDRQAATKNRS